MLCNLLKLLLTIFVAIDYFSVAYVKWAVTDILVYHCLCISTVKFWKPPLAVYYSFNRENLIFSFMLTSGECPLAVRAFAW